MVTTPVDSPITLRRGYGLTFGIRFATAVDLTQCEIVWVLSDGPFSGAPIRFTKTLGQGVGVSRDDVSQPWLITIDIDEADTVHLPCGTYYHECKVTPPSVESHCPASGTVTVFDSPIPPLL